MENGEGKSAFRLLIRAWGALRGRKTRLLQAGEISGQGPAIYAVSHPSGLREALVLANALERPVQFLLPENSARGPLSRFVARRLGCIFLPAEKPIAGEALGKALDVLAANGSLVMFADPGAGAQNAIAGLAAAAASLVWRAESQDSRRRVAVHPVNFFLPESGAPSREILIYVESALERPPAGAASTLLESEKQAFAAELESRLRDNAFQLRPPDLDYFLADLEETLRGELQEEWNSLPDWKQDIEGFTLSRQVAEWVRQTNYLNPSPLVTLSNSLADFRSLQRKCALRQLEVEQADTTLKSGRGRALLWAETVLGLPIALFGLVNHLLIALALFLAGSFRKENPRPRLTVWAIRGGVALAFYVMQILLVAHVWGRATAGYYAPALPVSGLYLWRYARLARPQGRILLISATLPSLKRKIQHLRQALRDDLDRLLATCEEKAGATR